MNNIQADSICVVYNGFTAVDRLNVSFEKAEIVSIIGPNGSGKSTILKTIGRLLKPTKGVVLLNGRDIHSLPVKEVARKMSILPQGPQIPEDITVRDLVAYGRAPYHGMWSHENSADREIIEWALKETHMDGLAYRKVNTLSGGERQRAWIAMCLAQKPQIMLLDEPTTFLDIHHQFEIMELLQRLHQRLQITIIMVIHDLNLAARYSHRVIVVKEGRIFKDGPPADVITEETLSEVFGIRAKIVFLDGVMVCIPCGICEKRIGNDAFSAKFF